LPPPKSAFVDGGVDALQRHEDAAGAARPRDSNSDLALLSVRQPASNGSGGAAQDFGEWSSSEDLEDDGGDGGDDNAAPLVGSAADGVAEVAVSLDVDPAASVQPSAWIDLVPVSDLAASLDINDSIAFGLEHRHLHDARLLSQSLLSHFGSNSREMVMAQRFIRPFFNNVLRAHTLGFISQDADEAFGQLLQAESASKVNVSLDCSVVS
jgi:hypothetical protein